MSVTLSPFADGVNLNLDELLYYKQHTVHWLPPAKSLWAQQLGQHQSRQLGRGMDFSEVRQYQAGDDVRSIDWRVTARTGKVHTKLFTEEKERPVYLYIDLSSSMNFGSALMLKSVMAAHFSALVAWLSAKGKDRVGAIVDTGNALFECKATASSRGVLHLLNLVTSHHDFQRNVTTQQNFDGALDAIHRLCPKGSEIIFISDFSRLTQQDKERLSHIRAHNSVRLVHIYDPLEQGMTQYRGVEQVTTQTRSLWLDFSSARARSAMKSHFKKNTEQLEAFTQQHGMTFLSLSNDRPLLSQLSRS
ncbi:DUF58 domain-containing protein [Vibrio astriarenae]|uniref:DUF58 domain-containing protein n=1 Tax=Vibrio astriarenae TaxID=1481923 RepID=UPI0037358012